MHYRDFPVGCHLLVCLSVSLCLMEQVIPELSTNTFKPTLQGVAIESVCPGWVGGWVGGKYLVRLSTHCFKVNRTTYAPLAIFFLLRSV